MTTTPSPNPDAWEIRPARAEDRLPLYRMLELYQHDLSDIYPQDLDAHGEYGYALDRYFSPGARHAFVGLVGGHFAGFALADGTPGAVKVGSTGHWMEQFFVLKKYRRSGFGTALARAAFEACPGDWEVGQMAMNLPAQVFWRRVIGEATGGRYVELVAPNPRWQGVVQVFTISGR